MPALPPKIFDFGSARVTIQSRTPESDNVVESLNLDLLRIEKTLAKLTEHEPHRQNINVSLEVVHDRPPKEAGRRLFFFTYKYAVYGSDENRTVRYNDGTKIDIRAAAGGLEVLVQSPFADQIYDHTYFFLLSKLGEIIESRGRIRTHALTWGSSLRVSSLFLDPQGGKSTLAAYLKSHFPEVRVYSDEITIMNSSSAWGLPIRIAVDEESLKTLNLANEATTNRSFSRFGARKKYVLPIHLDEANAFLALDKIYWGIKGPNPRIRPPRLVDHVNFIFSVTLGLGLPQMAEFLIRRNSIVDLASVAFRRLTWALRISTSGKLKVLELNRDFARVAQILLADGPNTQPSNDPTA